MKKTIQLLVLLITTLNVFSQKQITIGKSCSYYGEKMPTQAYTFSSDDESEAALKLITDASGLSPNFTIVAGNVPNACATMIYNAKTKELERYIVYNQTFMYNISKKINYWASISILAHEVGHHLNGHSLQLGGSRPSLELEADKFSGFIMAKLGATLEDAQSAINSLVSEQGSTTHPPKSARLAAIANGWYTNTNTLTKKTATRPQKLFWPGCFDKNAKKYKVQQVFFKKNTNGGFSIISEEGYEFTKSDFLIIDVDNDIKLFWFPSYLSYGYIDNYQTIENGKLYQIKHGSTPFFDYDEISQQYMDLPGEYLIVYFPNKTFQIYENGRLYSNPVFVTSYTSKFTGDYNYVYQINVGSKKIKIQIEDREFTKAKTMNLPIITSGTEDIESKMR